jgi:D-alanyl-D-alanine carboxypeptidase/D-alanyl-D-alanine-endopeptidase (penicillin-binding protein 4)
MVYVITPHRTRRGWIIGGVLVVVIVVAAVITFARWNATPSGAGDGGTTTAPASTSTSGPKPVPDPPVTLPTAQIVPMKPSDNAPTMDGIAQQLKKPLGNKYVAKLSGVVIDPVSGKTLWSARPHMPRAPASSMKLLTGAAMLASVDPNKRLTTTVVKGKDPGTIVFVGGGDPTLSARKEGAPTVLPGGPTVADLAAQVKASGVKVDKIVLDTSYWKGPAMADGWVRSDVVGTPAIPEGYVTKMQPLMVDADRKHPDNENSVRTGKPAMTAGKALARALGKDDLPIAMGKAPDDATVLAKVESQPLSTLLAQTLEHSDNVLAGALARQTAIARGAPPTFEGAAAAVKKALGDMGLNTDGLVIKDGSGVSGDDRVPTALLGKVMANAVAGKKAEQRILLTGLPLAGVSGTLAENKRYTQNNTKAGRGWVRAKTGTVGGATMPLTYALVGYVPDVDGRIVVFAFNSLDATTQKSRYAQDALAAALRGCGCSG